MVEPITINIRHLAQDVRLPQEQVQSVVDLLDTGFPVCFIARYRKEATNNLDEDSLRQIAEELRGVRVLSERKQTILKTIESAGKLTPELEKSIREAKSMKHLEDIYLPFKPKRHNLAAAARESGLEPFALEILSGTLPTDKIDERASEFFDEDKKVNSVADVLLGAGHIIAEMFSCQAELVHKVRDILYQFGTLTSTKIESAVPPKAEAKTETAPSTALAETVSEETAVEEVEAAEAAAASVDETAEENTAEELDTLSEGAESEDTESEDTDVAESELPDEALPEAESSETESAVSASPSADESQEVTELFEQLKESQAEKGMPVVVSQNTLKKKKRAEAKKKLEESKQRRREFFVRQFAEYFQFSTKLRGVQTHRILALNRGEREKILQVALQIDETKILESVKEICVPKDHAHAVFLTECLRDALHRGIIPMLSKEIRGDMTEYAEKNVIKSFGKNLRTMLLQRPFSHHRVLSLEPSHKNGFVAVALDEFGNLLERTLVFLLGSAERREKTIDVLADMIRQFGLSAVAISGGSRIAEETVAAMIEKHFNESDLSYVVMSKAGLSAYAASAVAKAELPDEDMSVRAAVSLGRRLQNALNELVKIEPASLGGGMFHHEIRGNYLKQMLGEVVESCVNYVGVDLNTATPMLLAHTAGLNPMTARRIYEYRREHGQFRNREELKKVPGISETVFTHAAGFLRIFGGSNPLDATSIHPESYELAGKILEQLGFSLEDLRSSEKAKNVINKITAEKIGELSLKLSTELGASLYAVKDLLFHFSKPEQDAREAQPPVMFRKKVLQFENLTPGTELVGTILNVTDFGAFVDIGLRESGFIHISQMATGYIRDAHERVNVGDVLHIWVVEVDSTKKRVSLTLLPPGTIKQPPHHRSDDKEHSRQPREHSPRPQREQREHRESSERSREGQSQARPPRDSGRDSRDGRRFDRKHSGGQSFDRTPKTFVSAPVKKEIKPITEKMKQGKEPMRSFSDLAQLLGRTQAEPEEKKK